MNKLDYLKNIYSYLENPDKCSLELSMSDTHSDGIFSLVISGSEFGRLTRVFIAKSKLEPFQVQLHTHRYPIKLTTIKGKINHYVAYRSEIKDCHTVELSEFEYKSPLNGGSGLRYLKETNVIIKDYLLPIGSTLNMDEKEFHTVSCSKGSIWIVEEQGFKVDSSLVLGVPFITEGLYNKPRSFEINDNFQLLKREIKKIILNYELLN